VRVRWSTASIRTRLTSWYVLAMSVLLAIYAATTFAAVRHEFIEQLDDQLYDDLETTERKLIASPDGRVRWIAEADSDPDDDTGRDQAQQVWSAAGQSIYRSPSAAVLPALFPERGTSRRYQSIALSDRRWRTLTAPALVGGHTVVIRVSRLEDRVQEQLREVLVVLALGLPLVVVLAGFGGYVLARRALVPIDHLAFDAQRITAERLHERLSVPNEHDEIGRLAAVINDTFARLERSFEQLRRFTADASHELRTPLSVIRGIGEAGLGETRTPAEYKDAMGSMLEEVDRLTNLVDTLLRLSHADAGRVRLSREPVDLGQLARDVASSLALLAEERRQELHIDAEERVLVAADRLVLREAVTNVLDNAIKYGPERSRIDLHVATTATDAVLTVADQGPGIPPEHRDHIFDRFFRVDEARSRDRGGTGLGLAIAKWAVDVNGGRISAETASGGGALFRIVLPLTWTTTGDGRQTHTVEYTRRKS
jgi:heavy metal sensor kinase